MAISMELSLMMTEIMPIQMPMEIVKLSTDLSLIRLSLIATQDEARSPSPLTPGLSRVSLAPDQARPATPLYDSFLSKAPKSARLTVLDR